MFKVGIIGPESTGKSSLGQYLAKRYGATYVPEYARDYVASLHRPYTYDDVCHIACKQIETISKSPLVAPQKDYPGAQVVHSDLSCASAPAIIGDAGVSPAGYCPGAQASSPATSFFGAPSKGENTKSPFKGDLEGLDGDGGCPVIFFDTELIVTRVWFDYVYGTAPDWLLSAMQQYKMDTYLLTYPDIPWIPDPTRENGSDEMRLQLFHRYEQEIQALDVPYYIIRHTDDLKFFE